MQLTKIDKILISIREHVLKKSIIKSLWYLAGNKNQIRISLFWCKSFTWMVPSLHLVSVENWKKINLKKHEKTWCKCAPHIGNPVKLFPLFPTSLNYLYHSLAGSSQVGPVLIMMKGEQGWGEVPPSNDLCQSLSHLLQLCLQSFKQPFALLLLGGQRSHPGLRNQEDFQDYLKVEAEDVAAAQNCPNLTTWCASHTVCLMMIMKVFSNMKGKYWSYWCQEELHLWQFPNAVLVKLKKANSLTYFWILRIIIKLKRANMSTYLKIYEIT